MENQSILIINQHSQNYGDDAAGTALVNRLLSSDKVSKIDIIYNSCNVAIPVKDERVIHNLDISLRRVGIPELIRFSLFGNFSFFRTKSDVLGKWLSIIDDSTHIYVAPCGANIGIYKDWLFLYRIYMVIKRKKTPIFHYNTIGKSGNFLFDLLSKMVLKKSKIFVREIKSKEYIEKLGMEVSYGPDSAFMLPQSKVSVRPNVIGFVPSEFGSWHPNFRNKNIDQEVQEVLCKEVAEICVKGNYRIELLPHLNTSNEMEYYDKIIEKLTAFGVDKEMVNIRYDIDTFMKYDEVIGSCQYVIGMRYHTIVLAAKNIRPFVSICYENKMIELSRYTNMQDYIVDLTKDLKGEMLSKFELLLKNMNTIEDNLRTFMSSDLIDNLKEATSFVDIENEEDVQ